MWREITKALGVFCFVSFVYGGEEGIQLQLLFFRKSVTISEGNRLNGPNLSLQASPFWTVIYSV